MRPLSSFFFCFSELNIYYSNSDEINDGLFDFDDAKCLFKEQKIDTLGFTSQKTMNFGLKTPNDVVFFLYKDYYNDIRNVNKKPKRTMVLL